MTHSRTRDHDRKGAKSNIFAATARPTFGTPDGMVDLSSQEDGYFLSVFVFVIGHPHLELSPLYGVRFFFYLNWVEDVCLIYVW